MTPLLPAALMGYLLGSIPTAWLLVRWKSSIDIRRAGSGNVGTLNSYEVTGSGLVGVVVLMVDLLKGVLAVALAERFVGEGTGPAAAAGAVAGHAFPVWLGFHGGRGLATGAGAMLLLSWPLIAVWGAVWAAAKALLRDVNAANATATVFLLLAVALLPDGLVRPVNPDPVTAPVFTGFVLLLLAVILVRLMAPVRAFLRARRGGATR